MTAISCARYEEGTTPPRREVLGTSSASLDEDDRCVRPDSPAPRGRRRQHAEVERAPKNDRNGSGRLWERHSSILHGLVVRLVIAGHDPAAAEAAVSASSAWTAASRPAIDAFARANAAVWAEIAANDASQSKADGQPTSCGMVGTPSATPLVLDLPAH